MKVIILSAAIFAIAVLMTMAGHGGGNFYVLAQVIAGVSMQQASSTGQFIMFLTAAAAMIVFQKNKTVAWPMVVFFALTTSLVAFFGGLAAHLFEGIVLKYIFAIMLMLAGLLMLFPVSERTGPPAKGRGYFKFKMGEEQYSVNLWLAVPVSVMTGFASGMVGVSGGSFLVPLMYLACRLPMKPAVGTASVMVAATSFMGFLGHLPQGTFDIKWALPQAVVGIIGGVIGGKLALKTKPKGLKYIFAVTIFASALFMGLNALITGTN